MHAEIRTVKEPILRVKIVEQRSNFDLNPTECLKEYESQQEELKNKIKNAQQNLTKISIDYDKRVKISQICSELDVDGLRGDIVINRAAKALAAFEGSDSVSIQHIRKIVTLCLRHRLRKDPLEAIDSGDKVIQVFDRIFSD